MATSLALASLTANYTDSEGEEGHIFSAEEIEISSSFDEAESSVPDIKHKHHVTLKFPASKHRNLAVSVSTVSNLVSYHDDTILSDDDTPSEKPQPLIVEIENPPSVTIEEEDEDEEEEIELPPEPQGRCSNELQEKISRLHEEKVLKGLDMNQLIQKRKDFRNPSIYEKLIQYCGINEFGTNYSLEMYDPRKWGKSSFYDELSKLQEAEMAIKEKERREKTKVEFLMGTAKKSSSNSISDEDAKRRKSKWDQVGSGSQGVVRPPGLLPLTSTATGTKGTVISAFGSLPKKPRA